MHVEQGEALTNVLGQIHGSSWDLGCQLELELGGVCMDKPYAFMACA